MVHPSDASIGHGWTKAKADSQELLAVLPPGGRDPVMSYHRTLLEAGEKL